MTPIYSYWNETTQDTALSTDAPSIRGYRRLNKLEGYVFDRPLQERFHSIPGTIQTDATISRRATHAGGDGQTIRVHQTIVRTTRRLDSCAGFGDEQSLVTAVGYDSDHREGVVDVLIIRVNFQDVPLQQRVAVLKDFVFENRRSQSIEGLLRYTSSGRLGLRDAGVVTVTVSVTRTQANQNPAATFDREVLRLADAEFDFARLDRDRNGKVTSDEAYIIVVNAMPRGAGGGGGQGGPPRS